MEKKKKLSKKQLAVLEDLFDGGLTQQEILSKHNISRNILSMWLADEAFAERFDMHIAAAYRRSAAKMALNATLAADRLIKLTESGQQETARKACLDIINMPPAANVKSNQPARPPDCTNPQKTSLSEQTAGKLLAALAEEKCSD